jgi:hypothetical protein
MSMTDFLAGKAETTNQLRDQKRKCPMLVTSCHWDSLGSGTQERDGKEMKRMEKKHCPNCWVDLVNFNENLT